MSEKQPSRYNVPNLERALLIMELLSKNPYGMMHNEIVAETGYPDNSVYRITMTLVNTGYLLRDEITRRFHLSRKLLVVGYAAMNEVNLSETSLDVMRELRDELHETVMLCTLAGNDVIVLDQVLGLHPFKFTVEVGSRVNLHTSAPGKALLAFLPAFELNPILEKINYVKYNDNTIIDPVKYKAELNKVRIQGFSLDNAEELAGVHCIGAVILDQTNYPVASIAITGPANRIPQTKFEEYGIVVRSHAQKISQRLGNNLLNF